MKNRIIKSLLLFLGMSVQLMAFPNQFSMDQHFSPHSSSNNFLAMQDVLFNLQHKLPYDKGELPKDFELLDLLDYSSLYKNSDLSDWKWGLPKVGLRALELRFIWQPIGYMASVVQHEIFGHGYRLRSYGSNNASVIEYAFNFELGWKGLGGGASTLPYYKRAPSPTELLCVGIGGMEGDFILGHNIVMSWLEKGVIDARQASQWREAHFNTANYIRDLKKNDGYGTFMLAQISGHDIAKYLTLLNQIYPMGKSMDKQLQGLQNKAILSYIFNPMTYLSYYSELCYVLFGASPSVPGIKVQEMFFLPSYHQALTPFGPEDVFEVFIWNKEISASYIYFKTFDLMNEKHFGLGFENRRFFNRKWGSLGLKVNLWFQPQMLLDPMHSQMECYWLFQKKAEKDEFWILPTEEMPQTKGYYNKTFGGSSALIYSYGLKNQLGYVSLELGYKTQGYLPGEPLLRSPIAKCGLQVQF